MEKRASGAASYSVFIEECQGAAIVSIGSVLLFVLCVLCSALLKGTAVTLARSSGGWNETLETTRNCFMALFVFLFFFSRERSFFKFLSSDSGLEAK